MSYKVFLSNVGNPDFRQDAESSLPGTNSGYWAEAESLEDASRLCRDYIARFDLGGGNWNGGEVRDLASDQKVGHISYNGRFWEVEPEVGGLRF
jgi:hypothetical protein